MTLRELSWMVDAKNKSEWSHTSTILAMISSAMGNKCVPSDFNPMEQKNTVTKLDKASMGIALRSAFIR